MWFGGLKKRCKFLTESAEVAMVCKIVKFHLTSARAVFSFIFLYFWMVHFKDYKYLRRFLLPIQINQPFRGANMQYSFFVINRKDNGIG